MINLLQPGMTFPFFYTLVLAFFEHHQSTQHDLKSLLTQSEMGEGGNEVAS